MVKTPRIAALEEAPAPSGTPNSEQTPEPHSAGPVSSISRRRLLQMGTGLAAAI